MRRIQLLALLLVIQAVVTPAYADTPPTVKLGFITDLSGVGAYWGTQSRVGIEMARDEINSKGGNLVVEFGDHTFKPTSALSEAQKMLELDKVDALWVEFAPTAVAASSAATLRKKLFLNNSAATSVLKSNPYAFKAYLDYERGCREIGQLWKSRGVKQAGMIKLNAEFAELCLRGAQSVFPDLKVVSYDFSADVSTQVLRMKSDGISAIFNVGLEADMLNMLKACRNLDYHPQIAVAEPDALTPLVIETFPDMLEGVAAFGFPPIDAAFLARLSEKLGTKTPKTPEAAAMAYTHARQIYTAVSSCPDREIACITARMANIGADSTMQFVGWKNRIADYNFRLKEWQGGKLKVVK